MMKSTTDDQKREQIDRAITEHLKEVVALRTARNQLALISRLPPEIMSRIFLYVKIERMNRLPANMRNEIQWIRNTSHVTAEWRSIALNSANLWVNLPLLNARWTTEMMERSKMAGLTFNFDFASRKPKDLSVELIRQALERSPQMKRLALWNTSTDYTISPSPSVFIHDLPTSFAQLESLCISGSSNTYHGWDRHAVAVPSSLLTGARKLRELELMRCKINWAPYIPCTITQLQLHDITAPTLVQFLDALATLTELEYLDINNSFPINDGAHCPVTNQVHFKKLRKLLIMCHIAEGENFFHHTTFPPGASVQVHIDESNPPPGSTADAVVDVSTILAAIARSYTQSPFDLKFKTLVIQNGIPQGMVNPHVAIFRLFTDTYADSDYKIPSVANEGLKLTFTWRPSFVDRYSKVVTDLCSGVFPLGEISHIHLDNAEYLRPALIAHTIGSMLPKISYVKAVGGSACKTLIRALKLRAANAVPKSIGSLCFQNLSTLCFNGLTCENLHIEREGLFDIPIGLLEDCLIRRYEYGVEIGELILETCDRLDEEGVSRLRDIVVDVWWDEIEHGFEESDESDY